MARIPAVSHALAGDRRNAIVEVGLESQTFLFGITDLPYIDGTFDHQAALCEEAHIRSREEPSTIDSSLASHLKGNHTQPDNLRNDHEIVLLCAGSGGVENFSKVTDDSGLSWGLLWSKRHDPAGEKLIAVVCNGLDENAKQNEQVLEWSAAVANLLGQVDLTLHVKRGHDLPYQLEAALQTRNHSRRQTSEFGPQHVHVSAAEALHKVGQDLASFNWVLLEPAKLHLHHAGCGGLEELKQHLPADRVLFGVLRFAFPRDCDAPPIVKFLFIHWIGSEVSAVRRGQWNSKLEEAASTIRKACDFAFRKTAYSLADLCLEELIEDLARVTCATSSDTRQLSVGWYLEGMQSPTCDVSCGAPDSCNVIAAETGSCPLVREPAKQAIAELRKAKQGWILLTVRERKIPSSGGA